MMTTRLDVAVALGENLDPAIAKELFKAIEDYANDAYKRGYRAGQEDIRKRAVNILDGKTNDKVRLYVSKLEIKDPEGETDV